MKFLFSLLLLPVLLHAQTNGFTIQGNIAGLPEPVKQVKLVYVIGDKRILDSSAVQDGKFTFKGTLPEPVYANIKLIIDSAKAKAQGLKLQPSINYILRTYLSNGDIAINTRDMFSTSTVAGSEAQDDYLKVQAQTKPYDDQLAEINKKFRDTAYVKLYDQLGIESNAANAKIREINGAFVRSHPTSPYVLFALQTYAGPIIKVEEIEPLFEKIPIALQKSTFGEMIHNNIEAEKRMSVGQLAQDFTQNDTLGKPVSLSSFKGKYVLVDFWASWCHPCRNESPHLVSAFNKYKDKNFTILGISLDGEDGKKDWLKAIHDDGLAWTQVSDLKFFDNAVVKQYNIMSIPRNILIDPDGKIVAHDLRGEALEQQLQSILGSK